MEAQDKTGDRFTISYAVWIGLLLLLIISSHDLDRIFNLYAFLVPLLMIPAIIISVVWIAGLIKNLFLRRWKRAASIVAAPIIASAVLFGLALLGINPERIRLELGRPYYVSAINQLPQTGLPRFKIFKWGSTGGVAVANFIHTLIYDESDEIGLPPEQRSADWNARAYALCPGTVMCSILAPEPPRHSVQIKKIQGHFYSVTEIYD
jgi:hypothetical protein